MVFGRYHIPCQPRSRWRNHRTSISHWTVTALLRGACQIPRLWPLSPHCGGPGRQKGVCETEPYLCLLCSLGSLGSLFLEDLQDEDRRTCLLLSCRDSRRQCPLCWCPCPLQSTWEVVPRKLGAQLHPSSCHDTRTGTGDSACVLPKDLSARITEVLSRNDLGSRLLISFRGDQGPHLSLGH